MPRAGLNGDRVVDEAERIADEVGLANLTLAALAERLGVRQPSLYKHIDGLAGLRPGGQRVSERHRPGHGGRGHGRGHGDGLTEVG